MGIEETEGTEHALYAISCEAVYACDARAHADLVEDFERTTPQEYAAKMHERDQEYFDHLDGDHIGIIRRLLQGGTLTTFQVSQ